MRSSRSPLKRESVATTLAGERVTRGGEGEFEGGGV